MNKALQAEFEAWGPLKRLGEAWPDKWNHGDHYTVGQVETMMEEAARWATERAAKEAMKFSVSSHMMLHAGECTAGELRTGKAIANGIAAAIRAAGGEG